MDLRLSLWLTAPEDLLSIAGLLLLLVAAWGGDRQARTISIVAVAVLVACMALVAPALAADQGVVAGRASPGSAAASPAPGRPAPATGRSPRRAPPPNARPPRRAP